ncbi:integrator complex subunit 11 [Dendrobium catenatum]|uniref:Integrator complex subunit 11 n=1 Tax=Dendrobium catenatum TaxID=906689 RepID=A0A2I0VHQ7_9ASPA|nr:integrator complex subunit 11 [Dendrobium catenatum]
MIFNTSLCDLSSVGHFFTWHNQQQLNPIHIKLDRILVNDSWLTYFPDSFYKVADPNCSDHSPLVLLNTMEQKKGHRFMFKNFCSRFPEFWHTIFDVFSQNNESSPLSSFFFKLKTIKSILKHKNWSNANTIQTEISSLKLQQYHVLSSIQMIPLDCQLNVNLKDINTKLNFYHSTLSSWMSQRAKVNWLTYGEEDLKFLYSKVNISKNKNRIRHIVTENGIFSTHQDIAREFISHFSRLFNTPPLPKCDHATNIKDFRPISLCNVIYKIIAKLIANRMKEVMPFIIHPSQEGFIHKRVISDNILLDADILWNFNHRGKQKYFCAKFDITKAFDTVSREFLFKRLEAKGFPEIFIKWIKACTTNVYYSICLNGSLEGYFNSSSGIRQGCPLSPYLFSIVMDCLSTRLDCATSTFLFEVFKVGDCHISHLMYADDLLVFGKASSHNDRILSAMLWDFAVSSGLHVNPVKSSILFSKNTTNADEICNILSIQQSFSPLKYLGLPIFYKKLKVADFQPLIQKISRLLDG